MEGNPVSMVQQWGRLQIPLLPLAQHLCTKLHYVRKYRTAVCKAHEKKRSLLHLINTVKSTLEQFSQYTVHDQNSLNGVHFIS